MEYKLISHLRLFIFIAVICIYELSITTMLHAQSVWYGREKANSINFEINKPFIPSFNLGSSEVGLDAWSSSYFLSGRYSLKNNKNITFVADIPFVHGYIDDPIVLTDQNGLSAIHISERNLIYRIHRFVLKLVFVSLFFLMAKV